MQPPGLGSDSGIENGRSSSCMGPLEKGGISNLRKLKAAPQLTSGLRHLQKIIQHLGLYVQTVLVPGVINYIADSLSKIDCSGDYSINPQLEQILFLWWNLEPTLDLFANQYNAILLRYVSKDSRNSNVQWIGAFSHTWENETLSIVVESWWPGQPWFTTLLQENQRWIILGPSNRILTLGPSMIAKRLHLPPGKLAAFLMVTQRIEDVYNQQSSQMPQDYQDKQMRNKQKDK
ncbi:MAG: hypothetical protein EZS28_051285, partial [Streblomastix strix]